MPDAPLPLSVAIVCKNNAATIARSLASVATIASEIVAVDSGSTDGTLDILREHSARVIESQWLGHVRTKQLALDACAEPWALSMDSDESVEPELAASIRSALHKPPPGDLAGYAVNRKVFWSGGFLDHAWQPEWRLRLVRRGACRWAGLDPHDVLEVIPSSKSQRVARLAGTLRHDTIRTMPDFLAAQAEHARTHARSLSSAGARSSVAKLVVSPVGAWLKQMVVRQAWRDGWRGWCAASATAAATIMKHAALLEAQRGRCNVADDDAARENTQSDEEEAP